MLSLVQLMGLLDCINKENKKNNYSLLALWNCKPCVSFFSFAISTVMTNIMIENPSGIFALAFGQPYSFLQFLLTLDEFNYPVPTINLVKSLYKTCKVLDFKY